MIENLRVFQLYVSWLWAVWRASPSMCSRGKADTSWSISMKQTEGRLTEKVLKYVHLK